MAGQWKNKSGWGRAGQEVESSGGVIAKLGAFSGWDGAVLKVFGAGAGRAALLCWLLRVSLGWMGWNGSYPLDFA